MSSIWQSATIRFELNRTAKVRLKLNGLNGSVQFGSLTVWFCSVGAFIGLTFFSLNGLKPWFKWFKQLDRLGLTLYHFLKYCVVHFKPNFDILRKNFKILKRRGNDQLGEAETSSLTSWCKNMYCYCFYFSTHNITTNNTIQTSRS